MNFYPWHLGDYLSRTAHLEPMEDLAYRRMLDAYYLTEGPLPAAVNDVARLIRLRDHIDLVNEVLNEFFSLGPDGWSHSRCEEELALYRAKADRARSNGHRGGRPKKTDPVSKNNPDETQSVIFQNPEETQVVLFKNPEITGSEATNTNTNTKKKKTHKPPNPDGVGFEAFWSEYPVKKAREDASKAWVKIDPSLHATIMSALSRALFSKDWTKDGGQFIPHPATWLNGRRWEDNPAPTTGQEWIDSFDKPTGFDWASIEGMKVA